MATISTPDAANTMTNPTLSNFLLSGCERSRPMGLASIGLTGDRVALDKFLPSAPIADGVRWTLDAKVM